MGMGRSIETEAGKGPQELVAQNQDEEKENQTDRRRGKALS